MNFIKRIFRRPSAVGAGAVVDAAGRWRNCLGKMSRILCAGCEVSVDQIIGSLKRRVHRHMASNRARCCFASQKVPSTDAMVDSESVHLPEKR